MKIESIYFNCKLNIIYIYILLPYLIQVKAPSYHSIYKPTNKIKIKINDVWCQLEILFIRKDEIIGKKIIISISKIKKIILIK